MKGPTPDLQPLRARYIELLKNSVLGRLSEDNELRVWYLRRCAEGLATFDMRLLCDIRRYEPEAAERYVQAMELGTPFEGNLEQLPFSHTMVGRARLENVEQCVMRILEEGVPGDFIECGVWRGGTITFMRGLLAAFDVTDRIVWAADSFRGLPPATSPLDVESGVDWTREKYPCLAADLATVQRTLETHGLLDEQVQFIEGWFRDSLPNSPVSQLALLRIDGDLYESTMDALEHLYDKLVDGGFVIVDDYFIPNCHLALDDFRTQRSITTPLQRADWTGVYWRKGD